ncbi:efflux RND transporter periplasmic adaptor subunit [Myxococcota bacterium]|nr:efflux RND transporter periplasmic adaptor subunit [Myxococcota bacterium]
MVKKIISILISLGIFGGIGLLVYGNVKEGISKQRKQEAHQSELAKIDRRIFVKTQAAQKTDLFLSVDTTGTIASARQSTVFSMFPGEIVKLKVKEGDEVKKGDILARLDAGKVALGYHQTELSVNQADIRLATVNTNYNRLKQLYEQGVIPKTDFEKIETEKKMTEQMLEQAKTARQLASASWSDATLKAPINGTVIIKSVEEGDLLSSAQAMKNSPLVVIADLDRMKIQFTVREQYIPFMKKGLTAIIRVDSYPYDFSGVIDTVDEYLDPVTRSAKATVVIENKPITVDLNGKKQEVRRPLKIGMFARMNLRLDTLGQRLCVPRRSVIAAGGMNHVFVYRDGTVLKKIVKPGVSDDDKTEILEGIQLGDLVVVKGQRALYDGQNVRLLEQEHSVE